MSTIEVCDKLGDTIGTVEGTIISMTPIGAPGFHEAKIQVGDTVETHYIQMRPLVALAAE